MIDCKGHEGIVSYDPAICWACVLDERDNFKSRLAEKEKVIEAASLTIKQGELLAEYLRRLAEDAFEEGAIEVWDRRLAMFKSALQEGEGKGENK